MTAPCKDCQSRAQGCHSKCPAYGEFLKENEKRKAARQVEWWHSYQERYKARRTRAARWREYVRGETATFKETRKVGEHED